jgi:very-short-patch-repair endonuclease
MGTSLPNAHMRGWKKIVTRERSLTKATRKIRNTLRRSLMVKPMLAKNGTQVMRVSNQKVMRWQRSLTKATRKIRNTLRRSLIVKPMLAKNGTQVMRVSNQKVMRWQP